jgi:ribosomal protein S18 acetylase RimI-like enzyme
VARDRAGLGAIRGDDDGIGGVGCGRMDAEAVLAAYDEQIRRRPQPEGPGACVETDGAVARHLSGGGGWCGVTWSRLDETTADAVIAAEVARFAEHGQPWEWKHHSHDEPPDLAERLKAAGLAPEQAEALLVAEIAALDLEAAAPAGVEIVVADDPVGVEMVVAVHDRVFGEDGAGLRGPLLAGLDRPGPPTLGVVALAGGEPVGAARVEFHAGTEFASLWGGGTLPEWRGRGIFRALVARRALLAATRGYRYLLVDALPTSEPILARLGFVRLATTTPFTHPGRGG